jgi:hypothetical protein
MTGTSLNCIILFSDPLSSMTLNCTVLIPVQWITTCSPITHFSNPHHHSSHITFIEDTNNTQHMVICPTPQMYPHDRSYRGPNGPVAYAPTCYIAESLESDSAEHHLCSTPSPHHPPYVTSYISQLTLDRHSLDLPLDALNGHGSLMGEHYLIHKTDLYNLFTLGPYDSLIPDY